MGKVSVLHPPQPPKRTAQGMRTLMDSGSLNLRGIAAMLHRLEEDYEGAEHDDLANMLRLLALDVDREADAMSEVEAFLSHSLLDHEGWPEAGGLQEHPGALGDREHFRCGPGDSRAVEDPLPEEGGRVMATVKPIKPKKPVDCVGYEPVMIGLSKARAAQYLLEFLDSDHSDSLADFKTRELERAKEHLEWIRQFGHDALVAALDEVEVEYRKLGTNLLMKEAAEVLKPKDGA